MVPLINSAPLALSFLFQRLKWPVPMSRWRTAKEIRNLLNKPETRSSTTNALLDYLDQCRTESEVCEILTIVFLTSSVNRPKHEELVLRIHCPSILADMILERTYGQGYSTGGWGTAHSGDAPGDFVSGSYFEEHKTAHVPPIFLNNLCRLESLSGYPLVQHWAYEWKTLRDKVGTRYTRYPYYFDGAGDARAGITSQCWQRMREVYLSAYLRTLAYAVSEWHMPQRIAEDYCVDMVYGVAGFFDVEPGARPAWLSDLPEEFCGQSTDFQHLGRRLLESARTEEMKLVSLNTPIALSVQKFANLTLSAHLVTPDFELPEDDSLYEKMSFLFIADTFELKGPQGEISVEEACKKGKTGDGVAVCSSLTPMPFGAWQSDYFSMGLNVAAPYIVPGAEIQCTCETINSIAPNGKVVSTTQIWNDNWTPQYPRGGSTRCGSATMIEQEVLDKSKERLGRKLAYFIRLRIWDREKDYDEYSESEKTFFMIGL
ncbi:MAG: hypothetical protein IH613_00595 [Desulfuromonadales bacterium]|nr:hypothetical protein [Desulfuromonadales bacterium]